jgi:casein kinase II subunit beta
VQVAKYENAHFGFCPRVFCQTTKVVPCGRSDLPGVDTVKLFCPSCLDTYTPPSSRFNGVDGAFFGTTFPHLLFQTFKELMPTIVAPVSRGTSPAATSTSNDASSAGASPSGQTPSAPQTPTAASLTLAAMGGARIYVPRIYGFKVSERARSGPRMAWLRMRPRQDIETAELDRVDNLGRWREGEGPAGTRSTETAATESGTSTARARAGIVDSPRPSPTLRDADLPAPPKRQRGLAVPTRATSSGPPVQATGSVVIR